jgi:hypothetical protein
MYAMREDPTGKTEVLMASELGCGGIGLTGGLQLLFIGLKLGRVIDWSWFWVLSPIWLTVVGCVLSLLILVAVGFFWWED